MIRQTPHQKINYGLFRSLSFGIMCFFTLFCIAAAVGNNIFRDSYICAVCMINILALIFLTVLSGFFIPGAKEASGPTHYFSLFLLNVHAAAFFSALSYSIYSLPDHSRQITVLSTLCYFFVMMIHLTLWLYQKQFLQETAVTRAVTVLISAAIIIYTVILIINLCRPVLFFITEEGVYSDSISDYFSVLMALFCLMLLCIATFSSNLSRYRKFSFLCCIFAPTMYGTLSVNQEILSWGIYIWGITSLTILLPLFLIFFYAHDELENEILRHEKEQTQLRISVMVSQMQPHFLYNSLAIIEALCEEDPKLAAQATNAFSSYLRENMDFADKSNPISFSEELNHIKTYVWLEKLRFPNKLNVEYDISCTAFPVPALSVQPMVENAIKHGICKSRYGGTVRICSLETDRFYIVTVCDDGTGFDTHITIDDTRQHVGIQNTRYRIREMLGGSLDIESAPGKGTTVTIKIPK